VKFAGAGAVEFGEEDYLPAAESEAALLDKYRFGRADEGRLDVRVGIAFRVLEKGAIGDEAIEGTLHVASDIGIISFVDDDTGRGVRDVEMAKAGLDAGTANEAFDFGCDVLEFRATGGADGDLVDFVILRAFFFHPSTNIRDTVAVCLDKRKKQTA
jgi:hypothetical protein